MHDVMLFGDGWSGEVRQVEQGVRHFRYSPPAHEPRLREITFTINEYIAEDGDTYLYGFTDREPLMEDLEESIMRQNPTPI
ncbi:hypothetical protein [Serratia fonticola]|uniref:hypothetical protein n=1 Tax=Serratia fonticola TaxID=47917 RepID=UPI0034C6A2AA